MKPFERFSVAHDSVEFGSFVVRVEPWVTWEWDRASGKTYQEKEKDYWERIEPQRKFITDAIIEKLLREEPRT